MGDLGRWVEGSGKNVGKPFHSYPEREEVWGDQEKRKNIGLVKCEVRWFKDFFLLGYELNVFDILKESPVQIWIVFPFTFSCQSRKIHRNENKIIEVTYDFTTRNELFSFVMFLSRFVFNTHLIFKQNVITFHIQFHNLSDAQYLGCCYHMNVIIKGLCGVLKAEGTTCRTKDCEDHHGTSG